MAKPTKSSKTSTETEQVAATPVPVIETAPAVAEKAPKTKKPKAAKVEEVVTSPVVDVVAAPVVAAPVVAAPVGETEVHADAEVLIAEQSGEFLAKLQQMSNMIASLKTEYRALEKKWTKELKASQKLNTKRKRKAGNRAPSGFVKPTRISDELAKFLDKPSGTEMARTEVTRDINKYIRTNTLQDKENGRKINPDTKLATLLKLNKTDELTYFNLQRYMSPHFAKAGVLKEPVV
jgi:upstream activation factor subunit UAF30